MDQITVAWPADLHVSSVPKARTWAEALASLACLVLVACGGSRPARTPVAPEPEPALVLPPPTPTIHEDDLVAASAEPVRVVSAGELAAPGEVDSVVILRPAAAPPPPQPVILIAATELLGVDDGAEQGIITFERAPDGKITISGDLVGLPPNSTHAFYLHEHGDCSDQGANVGDHLDPTGAKHGPPTSSHRHAGDLGNLSTDDAGRATFSLVTDSLTLEVGGADSVLDRALVVHASKDNKWGDAGPALACGVIWMVNAQ